MPELTTIDKPIKRIIRKIKSIETSEINEDVKEEIRTIELECEKCGKKRNVTGTKELLQKILETKSHKDNEGNDCDGTINIVKNEILEHKDKVEDKPETEESVQEEIKIDNDLVKLEISDDIKKEITELRIKIKELKSECKDDEGNLIIKKFKFESINLTSNYIRNNLHPKVMRDNDNIVIYYDGYYHTFGHIDIRTICSYIFDKYYIDQDSLTIKKIKGAESIDRDDFVEHGNFLNLKNGVLNLDTFELLSHDPKYRFLYKIDTKYDPSKSYINIRKFLREAVDNENDLLCLQEYCGYTIYPTYHLHDLDVFLIIYGQLGHNRKTKTANLITLFLGDKNVSSSTLEALSSDRFECSMLYGKKANIRNDIPPTKIKNTGMIKNLVGGDKITAQRKKEQQFQFNNLAKLIFSCNALPEIDDTTPAFWKKVILLEFPNEFESESEIMKELTTEDEKSGFLNFALEGLKRLQNNKKFTYNHTTTKIRWDEIRLTLNPLETFFDQWIEFGSNLLIPKKLLYTFYELHSCMAGKPILSNNKFTKTINDTWGIKGNNKISEERPTIEDKRQESWKGINLKEDIKLKFEHLFYIRKKK